MAISEIVLRLGILNRTCDLRILSGNDSNDTHTELIARVARTARRVVAGKIKVWYLRIAGIGLLGRATPGQHALARWRTHRSMHLFNDSMVLFAESSLFGGLLRTVDYLLQSTKKLGCPASGVF